MHSYDFSPLLRQWIGFDKLASNIQENYHKTSYPSYNIEKNNDNHYRIILALPGFIQQELSIELEGQCLNIKGKPVLAEKKVHYLHQGLIHKEFSLTFTLAEHMLVKQANLVNGILYIDIERNIPDSMQPRHITINTISCSPVIQDSIQKSD